MDELINKDRLRALAKLWRTHCRTQAEGANDVSVGFASSFTDQPLASFFGALLIEAGYKNPKVALADYNQIIATCLDYRAAFGPSEPDCIAVSFRIEDLVISSDATAVSAALDLLFSAITTLRGDYRGMIIVTLPPRPRAFTEGIGGFSRPSPLTGIWYRTLLRLDEFVNSYVNVYAVDMEAEITRIGEQQSLNTRNEILYRQPFAERFQLGLAETMMRLFSVRTRESKKCIVVDCDNTLWGGIIGEDGVQGVALSDDFPGRPFREFQKQLKVMRDSGIFLAVCSKNNPADVEEMFEYHSAMAIKKEDIAVWRVNWRSKSENLAEIAKELNIGMDSLVFIDDNPFEIEEVKANAKEITCLPVPEDTAQLPHLLKDAANLFDRLDITAEDLARTAMIQLDTARNDLAQRLAPETYLAELGLRVELIVPSGAEIGRVTQLINKTNQFNATTRRYNAQEVTALVEDEGSDVFCVSVEDRFGHYGIVGVAILRHDGDYSFFDNVLMSCRVLSRGIETAIISHAVDLARARGSKMVRAEIIPTSKNKLVADLFLRHDFTSEFESKERSVFIRDVSEIAVPSYIQLKSC